MRLIDADTATVMTATCPEGMDIDSFIAGMWAVLDRIKEAPTVDAVAVKVVEQFKWERDTAIQQLEEHRIPFCGKAEDVVTVVRCKDCRYYARDNDRPPRGKCLPLNILSVDDWYCADGERKDDA